VSAFSPICNPTQVPWGKKAFTAYLGADEKVWVQHDATKLLSNWEVRLPLLIDQGTKDQFLEEQLSTETFVKVCEQFGHSLTLNMREAYDAKALRLTS